MREFVQQHALETADPPEETHYTDVLQCFCKIQAKNGVEPDKKYKNIDFDASTDKPEDEEPPVC